MSRLAFLPQHRVPRSDAADGVGARTGDADHLAFVVDTGRRARAIAGQRRQLANLVEIRTPQRRAELIDLRPHARRIFDLVLGPADHLPTIVGAGREAVVAAERRQRADLAFFPHDPEAGCSSARRGREETATAPGLAARL